MDFNTLVTDDNIFYVTSSLSVEPLSRIVDHSGGPALTQDVELVSHTRTYHCADSLARRFMMNGPGMTIFGSSVLVGDGNEMIHLATIEDDRAPYPLQLPPNGV